MVEDIDRPDVKGTPPKMAEVNEKAKEALNGLVPFLVITTDDNLMSSVHIRGSFDAKDTWANGIFENSRCFRFHIKPMDEKRYYDPTDPKVTVELFQTSRPLAKFRKYTGPLDKVLDKLKVWLSQTPPTKG